MDFLSLFLCSILLHLKIRKWRIIISSLVGAFYAFLQMVVSIEGLATVFGSVAVALLMVMIAFSHKGTKQIMVVTAVYLFVSTALAGIMSLLYSVMNSALETFIKSYSYDKAYDTARLWIIISLTAIISVIFSKILVTKKDIKSAEISVTVKKQQYNLIGLSDSGNLLKAL